MENVLCPDTASQPVRRSHCLALLLLLAGAAGSAQTSPPADSGNQALQGEVSFEEARLDGPLRVAAAQGVLALRGIPLGWSFEATDVRLTYVRLVHEAADNPLGGDAEVKTEEHREERAFRAVGLRLSPTEEAASIIAVRGPTHRGPGFLADAGKVQGDPLGATITDSVFAAGHPGMTSGWGHVLAAPTFGLGAPRLGASLAAVEVRGDLTLVLEDAWFHLEGADGAATYRTGEWVAERTGLAGLQPRHRVERAYAVLEARDAVARAAPAADDATLRSAQPRFLLDGIAEFAGAQGAVAAGGDAAVVRDTVRLEGALELSPAAARTASPLGPLGANPWERRARLQGDASEVRADGRLVGEALPSAVRAASVAAVALGLLAAAWGTLQKVSAPFVFPLYARLAGPHLLSHRSRLLLFEEIRRRPLMHFRALHRATGMGYGCAAYHLDLLKREGVVQSIRTGGREHYYVPAASVTRAGMQHLAMLAHPVRGSVAMALLRGPATQGQLAASLGLERTVLSRHLMKLRAEGLVAEEGLRNKVYAATPRLRSLVATPPAPAAASLTALA